MHIRREQYPMCIALVTFVTGIVFFLIGIILISVGAHKSHERRDVYVSTDPKGPHIDKLNISLMIQNAIDPKRIKQNLEDYTREPHQAGTDANGRVAHQIIRKFNESGLENVHTITYTVLLSYPEWDNANHINITDTLGNSVFSTTGMSPVLLPEEETPTAGNQWLAFSATGTVTGNVVYCNRGTERDFNILKNKNIQVKGNIALIRYGGAFRGDKVKFAASHGAIGVILYSDPAEVALNGTGPGASFPNQIYLPPEGVQRGTVFNGNGDPLTPLYPSKKNLWNSQTVQQVIDKGDLPSIPCIPVSYNTALEIFKRMNGPEIVEWRGGLNVPYNIGPGMKNGELTTIKVNGNLETRDIQNIVGYIKGTEEPDRYVILGNHYDAWVYGALDPNSGTAVLAEVARATRQVMNATGWRPSRTIMFINWDAEEYGLFGSTEFCEEFTEILYRRAVAYINMDCLKGNTTLYVQASPTLQTPVFSAAQHIVNPRKDLLAQGQKTAYDTWTLNYPDVNDHTKPIVPVPMGGSDHKTFIDYLGIPVVNFYWVDPDKHLTYPLYHSMYETPFVNEHLVDVDNMTIHCALGKFYAEMAVHLADEPTIPYSLDILAARFINNYIPDLAAAIFSANMTNTTSDGYNQLQNLATTANIFDTLSSKTMAIYPTRKNSALERSRFNDRLISMERCFVNPRGMSGDPSSRHVLFSSSSTNAYSGEVMQQIYSILDQMVDAPPDKAEELGRQLAFQISIVNYSLICAINTLNDLSI